MSQLDKRYRKRIYSEYYSNQVDPSDHLPAQSDYELWAQSTRYRMRDWLPENRETPILDTGCGHGNFLYLLERSNYSNITGVDLSNQQIQIAQEWCKKSRIIEGDVLAFLEECKDQFGLVTGFDIIEHLQKEEILKYLDFVYSALQPGGRIILQTPNAESPFMGSVGYSDFTHEWFLTPFGLGSLFRLAGFKDIQFRETGPYVHGAKSMVRYIGWRVLRSFIKLSNLLETGSSGSGIYTRVFLASAVK